MPITETILFFPFLCHVNATHLKTGRAKISFSDKLRYQDYILRNGVQTKYPMMNHNIYIYIFLWLDMDTLVYDLCFEMTLWINL